MRSSNRNRCLPGLVALALLLARPGLAAEALELRVGLIAPLTGSLADLGASCREGATLAADEANRPGGLSVAGKRYKVVILMKDSQDRPERAVSGAQELINQDGVSAIIGPPMSGLAIPVARLADRAGVPMITQIATNPAVTKGTRWVFRTCYTDDFQGTVMARFAWNDLRARTAAVLYDIASDYPRGIADYFSEEFRRLGGRVLLEPYTTGARDFRAPLGRVKAARADVLFLPNYPADLRIQFEQARQLGGVGLILGTDTMGFRRQEDLERIERAYFSNHFSPDIPTRRVRSFVAAYQAAFNRVPTASAGPLTYDAFQLLFEAVVRCGSVDPANIGQSLRGTGRFEGVTGVMRFEGSPDPRKSVVIVRVQDGKASFHARVDP